MHYQIPPELIHSINFLHVNAEFRSAWSVGPHVGMNHDK